MHPVPHISRPHLVSRPGQGFLLPRIRQQGQKLRLGQPMGLLRLLQ